MRQAIIAVMMAALLPVAASAEREFERSVPGADVKEVSVTNVAGSVRVLGSDRNDIRITGTLGDDVEEVEVARDGGVLAIELKLVEGKRNYRDGDADLDVEMPAALRLTVTTTSADIEASGVRGAQRLRSVSGDVETEAWAEPVSAEAVSGDITVRGHGEKSTLRLEAVSGDVSASDIAGILNAQSVSGDVIVRDAKLELGRFETTSGDVDIGASLTADGRLEAESVSGDVGFRFAGEPDADFDVSSFSGAIENCFGPNPQSRSSYTPGAVLRFTAGGGKGEVRAKTLSGDVQICDK